MASGYDCRDHTNSTSASPNLIVKSVNDSHRVRGWKAANRQMYNVVQKAHSWPDYAYARNEFCSRNESNNFDSIQEKNLSAMVIPPPMVLHLRQLQTLAVSVQLFRKKFKHFKEALKSSPPTIPFDINVGSQIDPDFITCKRTWAWRRLSASDDDSDVHGIVGERELKVSTDTSQEQESVAFDTNPSGFLKVMRALYNCELAYCEHCREMVEELDVSLNQLGDVTSDCTADYIKSTMDYWRIEHETHWENINRIWEHYKRLVLPQQFEEYHDILGPGPNPMTQIEEVMLEFQNKPVDYDHILLAREYEKLVLAYRHADRRQRDYINLLTCLEGLAWEYGSETDCERNFQVQQTLNLVSCIYRSWRRVEDHKEDEAYALAVRLADVKTYIDNESPVP
ncbi:hypothetical protein V1506DRAFT_532547 [Lipomyces tetrasporus]